MTRLGSPATESGPGDQGRLAVRGSRLARRRRTLFWVAGGAALLAIGGLIGAAFVKSPQQIAADTAAPPATVTTAKVVSQILTSSVQMRGVVYPGTQYDVYPSAPESGSVRSSDSGSAAGGAAGGGSGGAAGGGSPGVYISSLGVAAGKTISNGQQLAVIDGEPMFALAGRVPAWRDITPGESGPDVAELQKVLAALGYYDDGDTRGYFGAATQDAVAAFYEHFGYTPPASGGMPLTDVIFLPALPAKVIAVNGTRGQQPGQPFLELAARGSLALAGELPPAYAGQVKAGLKVKIYDEVTGIHATGTVSDVGTPTAVTPVGAIVNVGGGAAAASAAAVRGVFRLGVCRVVRAGQFWRRHGRRGHAVHPAGGDPVQAAPGGAEWRERPGHRGDRADRGPGADRAGRRGRHHWVGHQLRHRGRHGRQAGPGRGHAGHLGERLRPGDSGDGGRARGRRQRGGERLMTAPVIELRGLARTYPGQPPVHALRPAGLVIEAGGYVAITGPSGSGKSTLLHLLGLLDTPTAGSYLLDGLDTSALSDRDRSALRGRRIGIVFQAFHLLSYRTALENVLVAELYNQTSRSTRLRAATGALAAVGLGHRLDALPTTLSGGECQRVAIARALVGQPSLLLCDEPTGNLDSASAASLMELLDQLNSGGLTIVIITHDPGVAAHAGRTVAISDGILSERAGAARA